jgi:hypothetical protein
MSSLADHEYVVLRQTIATRGTVRISLGPLTILGWASLVFVSLVFAELPVTALLSLAVLAAGFEAIHALHVGVERIGRYLQVFYEESRQVTSTPSPRWETTAMAGGPTLPGGGIDPLFSAVFLAASILNLAPAITPRPTIPEFVVIGALHLLFIARVLRARAAASKQRTIELEHYRRLLSNGGSEDK